MVQSQQTHFDKRSLHTIYIRENHKRTWKEFLSLIKKDEDIKASQYKKTDGLISIAIMTLIYDYVMSKNPTFKLDKN